MSEMGFRPTTVDDVEPGIAGVQRACEKQAAARDPVFDPVPSDEDHQRFLATIRRMRSTDPPGCWVAEVDGRVVGYVVAIRRGHLWGLSLLFVHPDWQGQGVGKGLLDQVAGYADGADVRVIQSSEDPRAGRRYAYLGLALHPAVNLVGTVDRSRLPAELPGRDATEADLDLVDAVDQRLRGVSRAEDLRFMLSLGAQLHVVDGRHERAWVCLNDRGQPAMLGADSEDAARAALWRGLAHASGDVSVLPLTAEQRWAVDVGLACGLAPLPTGPLFVDGWQRPPGPWIPSGIYF